MKIKKYYSLYLTIDLIDDGVNKYILDGWQPYGDIIAACQDDRYIQVMVKYED